MVSFMIAMVFGLLLCLILVFSFFVFDDVILLGYFKRKLQTRFKLTDVE